MNKTKKSLFSASCVMILTLATLQTNLVPSKISNASMGAIYMSGHSENGAGWAAAAGALGAATGVAYKLAGVSFVVGGGVGSVPWLVGAGVLGL